MYRPIKRFLVGNPISTATAHHERLDNQTALLIKAKLLFNPRVIVTSVPYRLRRQARLLSGRRQNYRKTLTVIFSRVCGR